MTLLAFMSEDLLARGSWGGSWRLVRELPPSAPWAPRLAIFCPLPTNHGADVGVSRGRWGTHGAEVGVSCL